MVQALINTADRDSGSDLLADADAAESWLVGSGLVGAGTLVSGADLRTVVEVREALRALVAGGADAVALAPLRRIADGGRLGARLDDEGRVRIVPASTALADRLLGLLLIVEQAQRDGTWQLLKTCANEDCRWVFYDGSRNHRGTWCEMASCGNKLKNRQFRARQRG